MASRRGTSNLVQLEINEFMDQPSVPQHESHIVTIIPPATSASSIASSNAAALGFQTMNSPCEGVSTVDVVPPSDGGATNTQSGVSRRAPQRPRSSSRRQSWGNPCSWRTFDLFSASFQITLLALFLSVFRDELPNVALRVWTIAYGAGCLAMLPLLYYTFIYKRRLREAQSYQVPQDVFTIALGTTVTGESQTGRHQRLCRFGKILRRLWISLEAFFLLWFAVGILIVDTHSAATQAPHLNRLCIGFVVFLYFRYVLPLTMYVFMGWCGIIQLGVLVCPPRPQGASANVISALPTYKFHARETTDPACRKEEDDEDDVVRVSIGGDEPQQVAGAASAAPIDQVVGCCICLDSYEDGVELKELPCVHPFHVQCIDRWLKINGSCPICKREVENASGRASAKEPASATVTV